MTLTDRVARQPLALGASVSSNPTGAPARFSQRTIRGVNPTPGIAMTHWPNPHWPNRSLAAHRYYYILLQRSYRASMRIRQTGTQSGFRMHVGDVIGSFVLATGSSVPPRPVDAVVATGAMSQSTAI